MTDTQYRLDVVETINLLRSILGSEKAVETWLLMPNPRLGNRIPALEMCSTDIEGHRRVRRLLETFV